MRKVMLMGAVLSFLMAGIPGIMGQTPKEPPVDQAPPEYRDKRMPDGWWTDPAVIEEGRRIYEGQENAMVTCFACHGLDGKPMLPGARDMRDGSYVDKMTDGYWYWRIAEGVPNTQMQPFKKILKEKQIWAVIAYEHAFSHGGQPAEHRH